MANWTECKVLPPWFIVGFILIGPNEKNPVIIVILYSSIGILYFISIIFLKKIKAHIEPIEIDVDLSQSIV
jgi:hypothetical protein